MQSRLPGASPIHAELPAAVRSNRGVPLALKVFLVIVVFGPLLVFAGILVWGAIQDGRDERRSKRVTRG
jgi:hypothetical protein